MIILPDEAVVLFMLKLFENYCCLMSYYDGLWVKSMSSMEFLKRFVVFIVSRFEISLLNITLV